MTFIRNLKNSPPSFEDSRCFKFCRIILLNIFKVSGEPFRQATRFSSSIFKLLDGSRTTHHRKVEDSLHSRRVSWEWPLGRSQPFKPTLWAPSKLEDGTSWNASWIQGFMFVIAKPLCLSMQTILPVQATSHKLFESLLRTFPYSLVPYPKAS